MIVLTENPSKPVLSPSKIKERQSCSKHLVKFFFNNQAYSSFTCHKRLCCRQTEHCIEIVFFLALKFTHVEISSHSSKKFSTRPTVKICRKSHDEGNHPRPQGNRASRFKVRTLSYFKKEEGCYSSPLLCIIYSLYCIFW